jgi:hypothetical protein
MALKGLGAASMLSPAPKVFSAHRGYETFSTRFFLEYVDVQGARRSLLITPEFYARVEGPYNRRNVYGAALSYGPVLPPALRDPVMRHALCGRAPLLRELGVDPAAVASALSVRFEPRAGADMTDKPSVLALGCLPADGAAR